MKTKPSLCSRPLSSAEVSKILLNSFQFSVILRGIAEGNGRNNAKTSITLIVCTRLEQNFRRKCTKSGRFMELKRHNKNGKKHNINKDFRCSERRLYGHHRVSQQDGE